MNIVPHGHDFLAEVCERWESAALSITNYKTRVVILRFGIVLSEKGGVLSRMLLPFKCGLGGALGSGKQYMSWILIDDLLAIIFFAITHQTMEGIYNAVSPYPVINAIFTKTLAHVLGRFAIFSIPAFLLRILLGKEMANQLLLNSTRVEPLRLTQAGYSFLYPDLTVALEHLLLSS